MRAADRLLLGELLAALAPTGPVVMGLDDTIERRWGERIAARGIYRDPVRSSRGHFVKTSGGRFNATAPALPGDGYFDLFISLMAISKAGVLLVTVAAS